MRSICIASLIILLSACSPKLNGTFEGAVDQWMLDSGGEYPVEYYRFDRGKKFTHVVMFCFPNERGLGKYSIQGDSIRFNFKHLDDPEIQNDWEISDTTWTLPFRMVNDSLLLIKGVSFRKSRWKAFFR